MGIAFCPPKKFMEDPWFVSNSAYVAEGVAVPKSGACASQAKIMKPCAPRIKTEGTSCPCAWTHIWATRDLKKEQWDSSSRTSSWSQNLDLLTPWNQILYVSNSILTSLMLPT